jgi:phage FluMu protein gp41
MILIDTIRALSVAEKRALAATLRKLIKDDVLDAKVTKFATKKAKETAKKQKIEAQIAAATAKLAKLTAKLA